MSAEACFQQVAQQVASLVGCDSVHILLGCPEPELRHPLLTLFEITGYCSIGSSGPVDCSALLQHESVRALCDGAIQSGQLQSNNRWPLFADRASFARDGEIQSIAIASLERPAGVLGLLVLTDPHPDTFHYGERFLLGHYLPQVEQKVERDLRKMSVDPFYCTFDCRDERTTSPLKKVSLSGQELLQVDQRSTELDRLKNEFISMVSHELRTPLTAIKGYAVLLQAYGVAERPNESDVGEMSPERQREYLDMIMEQTDHLEVLISDLLDVSRIHAGRLSLRCSQVDVATLCQRAVQVMQRRADQEYPGRYKISCNLSPDLPPVWVDSDRVQQVLTNLLENAVKYSPGGGLIQVIASTYPPALQPLEGFSQSEVRVSPGSAGTHMVHVSVCDQGIGIPRDQQNHLFKPFSRLEHSLPDDPSGAGLGLYITRKLVEAMGGSISLSSSEGEGTSVAFTLPIKSADHVPATSYVPMMTLAAR